jgi:hypothetical protein
MPARRSAVRSSNHRGDMAISDFPFPSSNSAAESRWEEQRLLLTASEESRNHTRLHLIALTQQAAGELRGLLVQRSGVMKRLSELRRVVRCLVELYGLEKVTPPASDSGPLPIAPDRTRLHPGPALQRACRIALMEIGAPASTGDIYDRIARRGSFQFGKTGCPLASIANALNSLVRKEEAVTIHDGACQCWQWRAHRNDQTESNDSSSVLRP